MSNFREMTPNGSRANVQKIQTLKISTYIYHFKARDLEIPLIQIFSRDI